MEHREALEGLLKRAHNRLPIVRGSRNTDLYKLAADFNNYGIPKEEALNACARFVDLSGPDPFTAEEIRATVESAYKRTAHGTKQWTPARCAHRPTPPVSVDRAQAFVNRHRLQHLVDALDLDMDRARVTLLKAE
ncbi:MAG: primase C-terminal domain-containing protein [Flavobacteriales bacterium]|nr:primase C-terminal domain-containing protein [Flavobacteriales bacterium]